MNNENFYCSIASGSKGNCGLLSLDDTIILVDIGITYKSLIEALTKLGLHISDISALLITHEHSDHIKGLSTFLSKTNLSIPTYASFGTSYEVQKKVTKSLGNIITFQPEDEINIKNVKITPLATPHDSTQSVAFLFEGETQKIGFMTDLGFVPERIKNAFVGTSLAVIESNYDTDMLWNGEYPYYLKKRIDGSMGHLSNAQCGTFVSFLADKGTEVFVLSHLSENNNSPKCVYENIMKYLAVLDKEFILDENLFISPVRDEFHPIKIPQGGSF